MSRRGSLKSEKPAAKPGAVCSNCRDIVRVRGGGKATIARSWVESGESKRRAEDPAALVAWLRLAGAMLFSMSESNMHVSSEHSLTRRPQCIKQNSIARRNMGQSQREHYQQHTPRGAMLGSREARAKVRAPPAGRGLPAPPHHGPRDTKATHPLRGLTRSPPAQSQICRRATC